MPTPIGTFRKFFAARTQRMARRPFITWQRLLTLIRRFSSKHLGLFSRICNPLSFSLRDGNALASIESWTRDRQNTWSYPRQLFRHCIFFRRKTIRLLLKDMGIRKRDSAFSRCWIAPKVSNRLSVKLYDGSRHRCVVQ